MFGIGSTELLVILLVALIVLGPKSLASFSSKFGKLMGEFRRVSTDFQRTLNLEAAREEAREAKNKQASSTRPDEKAPGSNEESRTHNETEAQLHGVPDDSPVAQALKKARAEAQKAEEEAAKAMEDVASVQNMESDRLADGETSQRESSNVR